jgi:hypothetical protein
MAVRAGQPRPSLPGAYILLAQYQHRPRSALGPRPGDLRREDPYPDRQDGCGLHYGAAGR